jgi:hypothetical protein
MPDSAEDPLKIYPDAERPSLLAMMGGGIPSRNPAFAQYAQGYNHCVDLDESQFASALSSTKGLTGHGGHYDAGAAAPASPIRLGSEIQADPQSVTPSKVTDIDTISMRGNVIGFVYRTEDGHLALQAAVPDGMTSKTSGSSWSASAGYSKAGVSGGLTYGQNSATTTTFPTKGDVVPLTQLSQLPAGSVVQPLDGTHSRQLLPLVPYQHLDQFRLEHPRPEAYTYEFSPMLQRSSRRETIDNVLGAREGENVTIVNGARGAELLPSRQANGRELGRV